MNKQTFRIYQFNNNKLWWVNAIANLFLTLCLIVAVMLFVFSCVTSECIVVGASMVPTYNADDKAGNDIVFINKYDDDYERGDVVVIELPNAVPIIKRVIGVGGDIIDIVLTADGYKLEINGKIIEEDYINYKYDASHIVDQNGMKDYYIIFTGDTRINYPELFNAEGKMVIPEGEYFVLGDNRHESKDSMYYGTFEKEDIVGTVEHSLKNGKGKFRFYVNYICSGKIFSTIANCF